MALQIFIICGLLLISLTLFSSSPYYILLSTVFNFLIVRRFRIYYYHFCTSKVILTVRKNMNRNLLIDLSILSLYILILSLTVMYSNNSLASENLGIFISTMLIWIVIFSMKKLTDSEVSYLTSANKLGLGYGTAIWYYKKYLSIILPTHFRSAKMQYKMEEGVDIPSKLFILCPKSCKVKKHIDSTEHIETAKDLLLLKMDHGGIKDREYRATVYLIQLNGKFFRCSLEYAQPLKSLRALYEREKISLLEMYAMRESFIKNLKQMLEDRENLFDVCELVEYDDETSELHVILSNLPSIKDYKHRTEE